MQGMGMDNPKVQACLARQDENVYIQFWRASLFKTPCESPGYCCYAMWCPWCASFGLRKRALHGDMNRYQCCNGLCPCSGRCGEQKCPSFCLGVEVALCFTLSVQTTRYMIQDELRIHTTKCDNCIIITMIVLEYLACIFHIIACITGSDEIRMAANILQIISDVVWCTVCACMQTQHKIELDERDKNPGSIQMQAPPQQHIQMGGGPPPGYGGYPPPQQQGYPPHGYPPPQHQGYPPPQHQGYPPPQHQGYPPQHQGYPPQGYPPQPAAGFPVQHPPAPHGAPMR